MKFDSEYTFLIDGMYDKDRIKLPFPAGTLGVTVSGGLDSAVLLCALVNVALREDRVDDVRPYIVDRSSSVVKAAGVIEKVNAHYGVTLHPPVILSNEGSEEGKVNMGLTRMFRSSIDFMYTAVNQNPPVYLGGTLPVRIKENPAPHRLIMPFLYLYKCHIVSLAEKLGVKDVVAISHSCTENPITPCGKCFQCNERRWGLAHTSSGWEIA